jgi:hypothetical protein
VYIYRVVCIYRPVCIYMLPRGAAAINRGPKNEMEDRHTVSGHFLYILYIIYVQCVYIYSVYIYREDSMISSAAHRWDCVGHV